MQRLLRGARSAFAAGILVLIPLGVTIWVIVTVAGILESVVRLLPNRLQPEQLLGFPVPGLGILLAVSSVLLLGLVTRSVVGLRIVQLYEALLSRLPIVSGIYAGLKQLTEALFSKDGKQFQQVVLVQWPRKGVYAVAFHTGESFALTAEGEPLVNIFLPTTPNPTSGFYLMLPESEVHLLDLTVEEAFKLIMSAGIVAPLAQRQLTQEVTAVGDTPS